MLISKLRWMPAFAALCWLGASGTAAAQTVYVRTTPGLNVELDVNAGKIGTEPADTIGTAQFTINLFSTKDKVESDVHVYVDVCGQLRRVILVEAGNQPLPPDSGCRRTPIQELLAIRSATTLVVTADETSANVLIRQGPPPPWWIGKGPAPDEGGSSWKPDPTGLIVGGGIGFAKFSDVISGACGDATPCSGKSLRLDLSADAAFWLTKFLAVDASIAKLSGVNVSGSGTNYSFETVVDTRVLTFGGKIGGQAGPLRLYALGGANYVLGASTTSETILLSTTTTGGTDTLAFKTRGWGWTAGAGMETWFGSRVGLYLEGKYVVLKGKNTEGSTEGSLNDKLPAAEIGLRVHLLR